MNALYTHPAHTCVDQPMLPCPACVATQPVLHPEHGYLRPSDVSMREQLAIRKNERNNSPTSNFPACKGMCIVCGCELSKLGSCPRFSTHPNAR